MSRHTVSREGRRQLGWPGLRSAVGAVLCAAVVAACGERFSPKQAPAVTSVSPNNGPLAGGTAVTITGTSFVNVRAVTIGGRALQNLSVVGAAQIIGLTPASSAAGVVDVTVYTTNAGSGTCTGCFTYIPAAIWTGLIAGNVHTCGVTRSGAAYCWGYNYYGQLGDGSRDSAALYIRPTPVAVVSGLPFASLTAGAGHTCGLMSGGATYCWGDNYYGELGDGSTIQRLTPVAVGGGFTFASLTAGGNHTCGLTSGGAAYCWGYNLGGVLGDGSTTQRLTPVAVVGGLTFASLTAGYFHTCGLTSGGAAYCWGYNYFGELGDGSTIQRLTPVAVAGGLTFASLTAGYSHTCGLTSVGAAYCWGYNYYGHLGDGSTIQRVTPVAVAGGLTFASLTAGRNHTCGLTSGGAAYCWGYNYYGELGDGSTTDRDTPAAVANP